MAQKDFGRRQCSSRSEARPAASGPSSHALPAAQDAGTGRSITVLTIVVGVVVAAAAALALALSAAARTDNGAAPQAECRGQADCTNRYDVKLRCGSSEEPKSVSVLASNTEAAEAKAERYNRGCRARGASFVAMVVRNAALSHYRGSRAGEQRTADNDTPTRRRAWRFRRR
jgi:hypothetical protein